MQWIQNLFRIGPAVAVPVVVQPILYSFGWAACLEDGYAATGWLLVG
jgi:hypothetical protein